LKLLIAEDDIASRSMLVAVTRKWGYEPVAVEDGEAAWNIMQSEDAPRLLLLDWEMPGLNGPELCHRVRQHQDTDPPFIILLTVRSETGDIVSGLEAGANEYIAKPFNNTELKARLQVGKRMLDLQTEQKQTEERLQLFASVFIHAREGITITDANGMIIEVNEAFSQITGYSRDEALGKNPRILQSGLQKPEFYTAMWRDLLNEGHWQGEIWNRRKNGEVYAEMLTISAVRDTQGKTQNYVALFSDITAQKEHQKQLEHMAHYDALTDLPNRLLLADRLQQAMTQTQRSGQPLAVAYFDLDDFKTINDTHGHDIGDQLLTGLVTRMKQAVREGDTLARLGGDEFVAVLIDIADTNACKPILTRLLNAAAQPVHIGDLSLQVSVSLGVTFYPQAEDIEADQLLRQADQAMYQAKLAGKNRYHVFDNEQGCNTGGENDSL